MKKMKLEHVPGTNAYSISLVDEKGNGIIVMRGNLGGCDFMNDTEREPRIQALAQMVTSWNQTYSK